MRIIIIDDDKSILTSLISILIPIGFECSTFSDPFMAYQDMKNVKYDLMITDINMQGMSGFELFRLAKLSQSSLQVIYISGLFSENSIPLSNKNDTLAFFSKPFQIEELIEKLNTFKSQKEGL